MDIYAFLHKDSKTVYFRGVRNRNRLPQGNSEEYWLFFTLYTKLQRCHYTSERLSELLEHLEKHDLIVPDRRSYSRRKPGGWRRKWGYVLLEENLANASCDERLTEIMAGFHAEGWTIINRSPHYRRAIRTLSCTVEGESYRLKTRDSLARLIEDKVLITREYGRIQRKDLKWIINTTE